MELRVLHCADFHLDSALIHLPREKGAIRREEQNAAFSAMVDYALEQAVSLVLIAGDLFDTPLPAPQTVDFVCRQLARLCVPVFISAGNHDFFGPRSYYASGLFPPNVHIFGPRMESVEVTSLGLTVHGASFTAAESAPLLRDFCAPDDGNCHLMCLHGDLKANSPYNALSPADIAASNLTYLALGHTHTFDGLHTAGKTQYAYCGTPAPHGFDECGDKGFLDISIGAAVEARLVSADRRRYHVLNVDTAPYPDAQSLVMAIAPQLEAEHLYKIVLRGTRPTAEPYALDYMLSELAERAFFVKLSDESVAPTDWEAILREEGLRGMFARRLRESCETEHDFAEALTLGLRAMNGTEVLPR